MTVFERFSDFGERELGCWGLGYNSETGLARGPEKKKNRNGRCYIGSGLNIYLYKIKLRFIEKSSHPLMFPVTIILNLQSLVLNGGNGKKDFDI